MTVRSMPPPREYLLATYSYDKETGLVKRRVDASSGPSRAGDFVGTTDSDGYKVTKIKGKLYKLHLLIWLMETGEWHPGEVDHRNGNPGDNCWLNLRLADRNQQSFNRRKTEGRTSNYKGVFYYKKENKWRADIRFRGKNYHLGQYDTETEAAQAYAVVAKELHGAFAREGTLIGTTNPVIENVLAFLVRKPKIVLTESDVRDIREVLKNKYHGIYKDLSRRYGVTDGTIHAIDKGRSWTHVT